MATGRLELRLRVHDAFSEMGTLYDRLGDEYRSDAYFAAAEKVINADSGIDNLSDRMRTKVDLIRKDKFTYPKRLKELQLLAEIPGFGRKTILSYSNKYPDKSAKEILNVIRAEDKLTNAQRTGLKYYKKIEKSLRRNVIDEVVAHIREIAGDDIEFEVAGSYRRGKLEGMGDIDILCKDTVHAALVEAMKRMKEHVVDLANGRDRYTFLYRYHNGEKKNRKLFYEEHEYKRKFLIQIDVRGIPSESYPFALFYFTGSKDFNVMCRRKAKERGLTLNEYGLYRGSDRIPNLDTEEQIIDYLDLGSVFYDPVNRNI